MTLRQYAEKSLKSGKYYAICFPLNGPSPGFYILRLSEQVKRQNAHLPLLQRFFSCFNCFNPFFSSLNIFFLHHGYIFDLLSYHS